ncbi:MAG: hypothetical protein R3B45_06330 [Bdellovibrionota bacterium]
MRRSGATKFPNSVQLFKFCQKVLLTQRGSKVHDQEVGSILDFNPSDCSHWKRGEKNVKSVFAMAKLAETLGIEATLIHDVASGAIDLIEAFYEYKESRVFKTVIERTTSELSEAELSEIRHRVQSFVVQLHAQSDFTTAPLYLPEVLRLFSFISSQPVEMMDKLSRILRVRPGQYVIQYRKGELKPQIRMSMAKDLAKVVFEGERERFPELGSLDPKIVAYEEMIFAASLLVPKNMLLDEMSKLDSRKNVVSELSAIFWAPKSLIGFQLQDILRSGESPALSGDSMSASQSSNDMSSL